jgi:hypothetical protein
MRNMLIALILFVVSSSAFAIPAMLVTCRMEQSVTGLLIYVGTYRYSGGYVTDTFDYYCPSMIEVY